MLATLRYAIRHLLKSPGFTAIAVLGLQPVIGRNSRPTTIVRTE